MSPLTTTCPKRLLRPHREFVPLENMKTARPESVLNDDQGPGPGGALLGSPAHKREELGARRSEDKSSFHLHLCSIGRSSVPSLQILSAFLEHPLLYSTRTAAPKHKSRPQVLTLAAHSPSLGCMLHQETHAANAGPCHLCGTTLRTTDGPGVLLLALPCM